MKRASRWVPRVGFLLVFSALAASADPWLRQTNNTLQIPANPPRYGYAVEPAFADLRFDSPVAMATPPGETNRLFVVEQPGRISVITNLAAPDRTVFLDLSARTVFGGEMGLLGLAFHPGYATNGYFYVFYTVSATSSAGAGLHDRLARFQTDPLDPNRALADSELPLISQFDEAANHNGGDLHFGPDGYLYVGLGDEGGGNDNYDNSQRIDKDFFSGMLRIDVDQRPGNLPPNPHPASAGNYAIPVDNPFVGATNFDGQSVSPESVRTEFYAVGLRNPWRFSFDPPTGRLYCGDVGQNAIEEIDIITNGGNYGWALKEGSQPGPKWTASTPELGLLDPIAEYGHGFATNQGNAVVGGLVYRGDRLAQLTGAYVFGDEVDGNIWTLNYTGAASTGFEYLTRAPGVAAFGVDPRNGDLLLASVTQDSIQRLVYSTNFTGAPLPPTLDDTGVFSDLANLVPNAGIVPYTINVPFWSDNARKQRWFAVPDSTQMIDFKPNAPWVFPSGTLWIKHFELELTNGVPESAKRLETRLLVKTTNGVYGVTYRWGDSTTNAVLVPESGYDEPFTIWENGLTRTQTWHYPSRNECLTCHTAQAGYALGFNTPQMNCDFDYGTGPQNQIVALSDAGYFQTNVASANLLPTLVPATNAAVSLEYRVRSYLAANCVQCHQAGGAGVGFWDARLQTPTAVAGLVNGRLNDNGSSTNNRVVAPGDPDHSMLLQRILTLGPGRMPPLATTILDTGAIQLLTDWIVQDLPHYTNFVGWQTANFPLATAPQSQADADPDGDGAVNYLEYLTTSNPRLAGDAWRIGVQSQGDTVQILFHQLANRAFEVQCATNLSGTLVWAPLDVPDNRPFFSATPFEAAVTTTATNQSAQYYRVRVYSP